VDDTLPPPVQSKQRQNALPRGNLIPATCNFNTTNAAASAANICSTRSDAHVMFFGVPSFEVESPSLQWMTQSLFVGTGARYPDRVAMSFYEVM
jgi:Protein of unknown function (DUF3237)